MVDPVTSAMARGRIPRLTEESPALTARPQAGASAPATKASAESVQFSPAARTLPSQLSLGAPIDAEAVARIKLAIQDGNYPLDFDKITDSLFASYRELTD